MHRILKKSHLSIENKGEKFFGEYVGHVKDVTI